MTLETVLCANCGEPFKVIVGNGIKRSRRCPKCRDKEATRKLDAKRGIRKPVRRQRKVKDRLSVDWPATHAARFSDKRSYVALDGRWVCCGSDMVERRGEVYRRDKGICQMCGSHVSWNKGEAHHVKSKGRNLRDDRTSNLAWSCGRYTENRCHAKEHNREVKWSATV